MNGAMTVTCAGTPTAAAGSRSARMRPNTPSASGTGTMTALWADCIDPLSGAGTGTGTGRIDPLSGAGTGAAGLCLVEAAAQQPGPGDLQVLRVQLDAGESAAKLASAQAGRSGSGERVKHQVSRAAGDPDRSEEHTSEL